MPKESKHRQSYRTAWESLPDFKDWLQAVPGDPSRAYCSVCNKTLHAHRISLLQHTSTVKHTKLAQVKFLMAKNETAAAPPEDLLPVVMLEVVDTNLDSIETPDLLNTDGVNTDLLIDSIPQSDVENTPTFKIVLGPPPISTHVLDTSRGLPVPNLQVSLYKLIDGKWTFLRENLTDPDGRCSDFILREDFKPGRYKLHYDVGRYFELRKQESIYPFIEVDDNLLNHLRGHSFYQGKEASTGLASPKSNGLRRITDCYRRSLTFTTLSHPSDCKSFRLLDISRKLIDLGSM